MIYGLCKCGCGELANCRNGYKHGHWMRSPERRKNMSLRMTGKNHPLYGKPRSTEVKIKIGKSLLGRYPSDATRKKLSDARTGKHHSLETRRKIGKALSGDNNPMKRPDVAMKVSKAKKGKLTGNDNPMSRSEVRLAHLDTMRSPEYRAGAAKRMSLIWKKMSYEERIQRTLPGRIASFQQAETSRPEEALFLILQDIFCIKERDRNFCVGNYFIDFFIKSIPLFWEDHIVRSWLGGGEENKTIRDYYDERRTVLDMFDYKNVPLIVTQNRNWDDALQYIRGCLDRVLQVEDRVYGEE